MYAIRSYYAPAGGADGEKADARSDIFSLGATFYEMVTGTRAFQGETYPAVIHRILNEEMNGKACMQVYPIV